MKNKSKEPEVYRPISINFTISVDEDMALAVFKRERGFKSTSAAMRYMLKTMAIDPTFVTAKEAMAPQEKPAKPVDRFVLVDLSNEWVSKVSYTIEEARGMAEEVAEGDEEDECVFALTKIIGDIKVESKPRAVVTLL